MEPSPFVCKVCGMILGEIYRTQNERITRLRQYRHPRPPGLGLDMTEKALHVKFCSVDVNDGGLYCEHCGAVNTWYANQNVVEEMLKRKNMRIKQRVAVES